MGWMDSNQVCTEVCGEWVAPALCDQNSAIRRVWRGGLPAPGQAIASPLNPPARGHSPSAADLLPALLVLSEGVVHVALHDGAVRLDLGVGVRG